MKYCVLLSAMFLSLSLHSQPTSGEPATGDSGFAFYLLRDSTVATYQILNVPIDSLRLALVPLFTAQDIKSYSWSTHTFVLKPKSDSIFKNICSIRRKSRDVPFVINVGNERIYVGEFNSPLSSLSPPWTYIIGSTSPYKLCYPGLARLPDMRSDKRIHDALQAAGVLVD